MTPALHWGDPASPTTMRHALESHGLVVTDRDGNGRRQVIRGDEVVAEGSVHELSAWLANYCATVCEVAR